jgi:plasmid stabilization system protein ParE
LRFELHPEADEEFAAQVQYYEAKSEGLGQRFYRDIITQLEWIAQNPTVPRLRKNYRRLNVKAFPFYIAYVAKDDLVWVLAVAHVRRKPGYWWRRLKRP